MEVTLDTKVKQTQFHVEILAGREVRVYDREYPTTNGLRNWRVHSVVAPFTDLSDYVANVVELREAVKPGNYDSKGVRLLRRLLSTQGFPDMLYFEIGHIGIGRAQEHQHSHTGRPGLIAFLDMGMYYELEPVTDTANGVRIPLRDLGGNSPAQSLDDVSGADKGCYVAEAYSGYIDDSSIRCLANNLGSENHMKILVNHGGWQHYHPEIRAPFILHRIAPSDDPQPLAPPTNPFSHFLPV